MLAHHVSFGDRLPEAGEESILGLLDVATSDFQPVATTTAWNFLMGSMAQFVGDGDRIWYNQHHVDGIPGSCIQNLVSDEAINLDSPIYWVDPAGEWAVGYDMERAYWCTPGYGYLSPLGEKKNREELSDREDGLRKVYADGRPWELLVSYEQITETIRPLGYEDEFLFLRRIYGAGEGKLVFSASHVSRARRLSHWLFLYDCERRKLDVLIHPDQELRHFLMQTPETLMVSLRKPPVDSWKEGLFFYHFEERSLKPFERAFFMDDGYYQFLENGNHLVCGAFSGKEEGVQRLYSMRLNEPSFRSLAQFTPHRLDPEVRSNLSPAASRSGHALVVNSFHEDFRGIYLVNL